MRLTELISNIFNRGEKQQIKARLSGMDQFKPDPNIEGRIAMLQKKRDNLLRNLDRSKHNPTGVNPDIDRAEIARLDAEIKDLKPREKPQSTERPFAKPVVGPSQPETLPKESRVATSPLSGPQSEPAGEE